MKITKYNNVKNISGNKLKDLRKKCKMSQKELAEKLQLEGIDLTSKEISKIENNNRLVQDFELFAFAKIFKVSTYEFIYLYFLNHLYKIKILFDKTIKRLYNKYRKWRNHKRGSPKLICKKHIAIGQITDVFFYWFIRSYSKLLLML